MTTTNDSLRLAELLKTPICKMDGEELAFLITNITSNQQAQVLLTQKPKEEHNVYGIAGIAQIFGCSIPTASRIKKGGTTRLSSVSGRVPRHHQRCHHSGRQEDCGQCRPGT